MKKSASSLVVRVAAVAALLGVSLAAAPVSAASVPNAPDGLRLIPGRYRAVAVWNAPVDNGVPYTGYVVTASNGADVKTCTTNSANIKRCIVTGLTPQTEYSFTVRARSAGGNSDPSSAVTMMSWWQPQSPRGGTDFSNAELGNIDLTFTNLSGGNFTSANFAGSNMRGANLKDATITSATFGNAELAEVRSGGLIGTFATARQYYTVIGGYLIGPSVNLWNEDLSGFDLSGQNLWGAQLSGANFTGANLTNANLAAGLTQSTIFTNANLDRTNLRGTIATGANFTGTSLATAKLGTQMRTGSLVGSPAMPAGFRLVNGSIAGPNVSLWRANLVGGNLAGLDLTNTKLYEADLSGANLAGSTVTGADFGQATLTGVTGAVTGTPLRLPAGWRIQGGAFTN